MRIEPNHSKPSVKDWGLLVLSCLFVMGGLFVVPSDRNVGIVTIAFFGSCAVTFAWSIFRKLQLAGPMPLQVEIVGGVPIRPSRLMVAGLGIWIAGLGLILLVFGWSYGLIFRGLAAFMAVVGAVLLLGLASGRLPVGYLQFEPAGMIYGRRLWSCLVEWDNIAGIAAIEISRTPLLLIKLHNPDRIQVNPSQSKARIFKSFARNEALYGGQVVVSPRQYRMDPRLLMQALLRYTEDPAARMELGRRHVHDEGRGTSTG